MLPYYIYICNEFNLSVTHLSLFSAKAVSVMSISGQNPSVMEGDTFNLSVSIDAAPTLSDFVVVIRNNTPGNLYMIIQWIGTYYRLALL